MSDPVCLISGVGPGTGTALARRFASGGYRVAMLARNEDRLRALESEIECSRAYVCDVSDSEAVRGTVANVRGDLGAPTVLVHNAVGGAFGDFLEIEPEQLRANFEVNVMGLLYLARALAPAMIEAGRGAIMVTGNTAARRGVPRFAGFAPTKAGQRILAESMARSLGPQGVHVAYFVIDAVIDLEWTRRRMPDQPDDFFIKPEAIAENVWYVAHQDPSAWSFEVELRPYGEHW
ncbi:MAG: SDR family NAD(P)-dependent oxidoreductase [Holophagales bacterium]|nr:SDR family NAD(P)-dependent oxidoreductase [Holophagales bacterium]MYG29436.1 SDR family NAD(P)-dependent oxidoreductase [Holophagales bacterium]MYI80046.1 SDR family NAD(P)-dependent oxidoreductase [Holophagales bacterium]